jgi:hypothetical protein
MKRERDRERERETWNEISTGTRRRNLGIEIGIA